MAHPIRGKTAIIGIGAFGNGEAPGWSATELMCEAAVRAVKDAGLQLHQVDAVFGSTANHAFPTMTVAEHLGIRPKYWDGTNVGGSSFEHHMLTAALALDAGLIDVALICYGSNQRTASGKLVPLSEPQPYETPYKPRMPMNAYALAASRHFHQYGTTREQLAEVAVAARAWANLNPDAFMHGKPLTVADVMGARLISDPFTALDCCLVTDGGAACVMVRADRAKDAPNKPAYLLGGAGANWHRTISQMPDLTVTACAESGPRAFEMAGLTQKDVDLVMLYDAFTINTILFLEDLGFCAKGDGGAFVSGGRIAPGGQLAVNTNGGGLSCVHPGMYGMYLILESVTQLRGQAGQRQLKKCDIALLNGNGGTLSSQVTALLGTAAAL